MIHRLVRYPDFMSNFPLYPSNLKVIDWKTKAKDYYKFIFDAFRTGNHLPLFWKDKTSRPGTQSIGLPSYVGVNNRNRDGTQEAINVMAAVLSGMLTGFDSVGKIEGLIAFFSEKKGVFSNSPNYDGSDDSFWYVLLPSMLWTRIASLYPSNQAARKLQLKSAQSWLKAVSTITESRDIPGFNFTSFDFSRDCPISNGFWTEPDGAVGTAYLLLGTYFLENNDKTYLDGAVACMDYIETVENNPLYELLCLFGPYVAARLNSLTDRNYSIDKLMNWVFRDSSSVRYGWGMLNGSWDYASVDGLVGSRTDGGGYAFSMNTFLSFSALLPLLRYSPSWAKVVGVWALNAANNLRFFYSDAHTGEHQSCQFWSVNDPEALIPYEGLRKRSQGVTPMAMGDPTVAGWGETDFSLYSGSYTGFLGAAVESTNIQEIFRFNIDTHDIFLDKEWPGYLYYNPLKNDALIEVDLAGSCTSLYEAVHDIFLIENKTGKQHFKIPSQTAFLVFFCSSNVITYEGKMTKIGEKPVVYNQASVRLHIEDEDSYCRYLYGTATFTVDLYLLGSNDFASLDLLIDSVLHARFYSIEAPLSFDTLSLKNGEHTMEIMVKTTKGLTCSDKKIIRIINR